MTVVAVGQLDVDAADVAANVARCCAAVDAAADGGAALLVLPECALTGYVYEDAAAVRTAALLPDGDEIDAVAQASRARGVTTVVGFLEAAGEVVHNSAAVLGADGGIAFVRKTHLPVLGADRFVAPGDEIGPVVDTPAGRIGVAVCYDLRFPEVCRALALAGAEVVAAPVNWSKAVAVLVDHVAPTRAFENRVVVAVANRADREGALEFVGGSRIVASSGATLAACGARTGPVEVATALVDLVDSSEKRTVFEPGVFEIDVVGDRRPALYRRLIEERCDD